MKLAVSTLGMPGQPLPEAIAIATAAGCQGLELRLHPDTGVHPGMTGAQRQAARAAISASGLAIVALAGYARVAAPGPDAPVVAELLAGLELARELGAPGLRAFPGGTDTAAAVRRVRAAIRDGPGTARVLVETHDDMPTGTAVARLLDAIALPEATAAIWDLLHPWRRGAARRGGHGAARRRLGRVGVAGMGAHLVPRHRPGHRDPARRPGLVPDLLPSLNRPRWEIDVILRGLASTATRTDPRQPG
jgi:sugar phosphate isomerase/epimerase